MGAKLLDIQAGRQFVDRYELIGEIASGGMATVYLGRLTGVGGFQRLYAIKRLHPHLQSEKEFVEMFLDEARLAAGIHHPNVVPILEVGASPSGYYLVMEYIEGDTLARLLARAAAEKQRLPVPMVIRLGLDMLSGLHAAHELRDESGAIAGVVHRDVSPQNVLVGADGISRITDFGVARAASRLTATRVGQLKGKIAYMAPEQARGDEGMDRRADVFASGIVLWEALAHRRLFKASNEAATLTRVLHDPLPELQQVAPHVPPGICEVIMSALERDRDRRISTCAEFADALEKAAAQAGVLGSARDMRGYLEQILGADIHHQREAIRSWTSHADSLLGGPPQMTPSNIFPSSMFPSATTPGIETTLAERPGGSLDGRRGRWLGIFVAVGLLGVGGFFGYRAFSDRAALTEMGAAVQQPSEADQPIELPAAPSPSPSASAASPADVEAEQGSGGGPSQAPSDDRVELFPRPSLRTRSTPEPDRTVAPAPQPSPRSAPAPAPASKGSGSKKKPLDILDSNPYR